jgi:hypothetical protein
MEDAIARSVPSPTPMSPLGLDLVLQISTGSRTNSTRHWGSARGNTPRSTPGSRLPSPRFTSPRSRPERSPAAVVEAHQEHALTSPPGENPRANLSAIMEASVTRAVERL